MVEKQEESHVSQYIFTNSSARAGYDTRSIFKQGLTGFNSEFSFSYTSCLTKAEEPSLPYNLPIAGGRIIGFIPFPSLLVLCEIKSVSSRIWTYVSIQHLNLGQIIFILSIKVGKKQDYCVSKYNF